MEICYKAFRRENDKLFSLFTNVEYKKDKVNILKYPAFVEYRNEFLYVRPGVSVWKIHADDKVKMPYLILGIEGLTEKRIADFWEGRINGDTICTYKFGYRRIILVEEIFRF